MLSEIEKEREREKESDREGGQMLQVANSLQYKQSDTYSDFGTLELQSNLIPFFIE